MFWKLYKGEKMILEETVLKATQIDEMVAYLCGLHQTSVKSVEFVEVPREFAEGYSTTMEIDPADLYEAKVSSLCPNQIDIRFENGIRETIDIQNLSPGITHYILVKDSSSEEGHISGAV